MKTAEDYLPCIHAPFQSGLWCWPCVSSLEAKAHAEALEEAAKVALNFTACNHGESCSQSECDCPVDIAEAIRALKEKP